MNRGRLLVLLGALLFFLFPGGAWAEPNVNAKTAVVIDGYTGELLWGKDADKLRAPASTIKMLTTMIALEQLDLQEQVTVGEKAHQTYVGQTIGLTQGDVLTVEDLVEAALLWSANDAAVALGEYLAETPELFSFMMNYKAWALGAYRSRFVNPNGYSAPLQYSTAYDLALIGRAAMQNPFIRNTVCKRNAKITWLNRKKTKEIANTNQLLELYPYANGIKTGTTSAAGGCLVGSAIHGDRWLVTAVLGSSQRYADTISLLDYGINNFSQVAIAKEKVYAAIDVAKGEIKRAALVPEADIYLTVPNDKFSEVKIEVNLPSTVAAPVKKGQVLGSVTVYYQDKLIGRTNLSAVENVKRKSIFFR
ncbi:MAG: D-alanyl-D-alanine carboxypeptidase family protein [Bacillota bacterium]|jgi:D-alanyl-D-alanine carboxypeptidase (penicillin-binding protein 5/6)